jgi:phosphopantothenoylcysteine decarboxylase/phosphopantothenate--cysteine ligase
VRLVRVTSAADMYAAVLDRLPDADVLIKSAAVADYRPVQPEVHKVKKTGGGQTLRLERTQDILETAGQRKTHQVLVGFAAETRDLDENAAAKLASKNLDMLVGNLIGAAGSGFETDTNQVTLYYRDGSREPLAMMPKTGLAHILLDRVVQRIQA